MATCHWQRYRAFLNVALCDGNPLSRLRIIVDAHRDVLVHAGLAPLFFLLKHAVLHVLYSAEAVVLNDQMAELAPVRQSIVCNYNARALIIEKIRATAALLRFEGSQLIITMLRFSKQLFLDILRNRSLSRIESFCHARIEHHVACNRTIVKIFSFPFKFRVLLL